MRVKIKSCLKKRYDFIDHDNKNVAINLNTISLYEFFSKII